MPTVDVWVGIARYGLWIGQSALALFSAYAVSARIAPNRGTADRLLVAGSIATTTVLLIVYTTSLISIFRLAAVVPAALLLHSGFLLWAAGSNEQRQLLGARLRSDATAMPRALLDGLNHRDLIALLPICFCVVTLTLSAIQIWFLPNWAWDCVWYHKPMTNYVVQTGSLDWVASNIPHLNSYPRHTEMLAAWDVLLTGSTRLDDLPQLPLGLLGAIAVAALCRRANASPGICTALGCVWLSLPAVGLQLQTTHADVAGAAFFLIGFYFLTDPQWDRLSRWMTFLNFGLYAGTKGTGLFHFGLLLPWIVYRYFWALRHELPRGWIAQSRELLFLLGSLSYPGFVIYIRNILRVGNPYWPVKMRIPLLGIELPGVFSSESVGIYPPAFFGFSAAGVRRMLQGWFSTEGAFFQDLREFPFGFVFPYLLLPALVLLIALTPFSRGAALKQRFSLLALAVLAVLVPAAWWGRFTLALPAAGLAAYATFYPLAKGRSLSGVLSSYLVLLLVGTLANMSLGYRIIPSVGILQVTDEKNSKSLREIAPWLWPDQLALLREREFRRGDTLVYDESATFVGEFWTEDVRNRIEHRPQQGMDVNTYLAAIDQLGARWLVIGTGTPVEQRLRSEPQRFEFVAPLRLQTTVLYRVVR